MSLDQLNQSLLACKKCPRLLQWQEHLQKHKKRCHQHETYWSKPVPSFGDPKAQLLIVGLAPGAHGANRTGRLITGDQSGLWLYRALHKAGLSNQALSEHLNDGLKLFNTWISNIVHCAPPDNKPTLEERNHCLTYFEKELALLPKLKVILCLGHYAYDNTLRSFKKKGLQIPSPKPKFKHGLSVHVQNYVLICSYHPSQQNTFTKKLTQDMLDDVFKQVNAFLD